MPSSDPAPPAAAEISRPPARLVIDAWTRKLHYYTGLFLLCFIWLFSVSGLILNHGWAFASFWESRKQGHFEKALRPVRGATDLERARDVLAQIGCTGQIQWSESPHQPGRLDFRVSRPGSICEVHADLVKNVAGVGTLAFNRWGVLHTLHVFRTGQTDAERNWLPAMVWRSAMDGVALGLVLMVLSGYWIWFRSGRSRLAGFLSLALGLAGCGFILLR